MSITLSKIKYGTRSIVHFEALEQTLRLRVVSGPADKKFFLIIGSAPTPTVLYSCKNICALKLCSNFVLLFVC
jgi:hypothetical protein